MVLLHRVMSALLILSNKNIASLVITLIGKRLKKSVLNSSQLVSLANALIIILANRSHVVTRHKSRLLHSKTLPVMPTISALITIIVAMWHQRVRRRLNILKALTMLQLQLLRSRLNPLLLQLPSHKRSPGYLIYLRKHHKLKPPQVSVAETQLKLLKPW